MDEFASSRGDLISHASCRVPTNCLLVTEHVQQWLGDRKLALRWRRDRKGDVPIWKSVDQASAGRRALGHYHEQVSRSSLIANTVQQKASFWLRQSN